ncbi:MAG: hypothetical protein AB4040_14550, partial [Synechococcus sp.]
YGSSLDDTFERPSNPQSLHWQTFLRIENCPKCYLIAAASEPCLSFDVSVKQVYAKGENEAVAILLSAFWRKVGGNEWRITRRLNRLSFLKP